MRWTYSIGNMVNHIINIIPFFSWKDIPDSLREWLDDKGAFV